MAVNVSTRNLLEPDLADEVARLLVQAGLPAALLKLEVTESAIMAEPERAVQALERLRDARPVGCRSTTSAPATRRSPGCAACRCRRSRSTAASSGDIAERDDDLAIVRAVIDLGHDLGLRVVAEGVEDERTWRRAAGPAVRPRAGLLPGPPDAGRDDDHLAAGPDGQLRHQAAAGRPGRGAEADRRRLGAPAPDGHHPALAGCLGSRTWPSCGSPSPRSTPRRRPRRQRRPGPRLDRRGGRGRAPTSSSSPR